MAAGIRNSAGKVGSFSIVLALATVFGGCGGGGGGGGAPGGNPNPPPNPSTGWTQGVFLPSSTFKNQCAIPRTGNAPNGQPFPDTQGSVLAENQWLRSWNNELYLWYNEVLDRNPAGFSDPKAYFNLLKTTATTSSGAPKDKFHFTASTAEWQAFSQSGISAGYGATFAIIRQQPPRELRVILVEPNTPAAAAGLLRGDEILTVDGVDLVNSNNVDALNAGLFPKGLNESHTFQVRNGGGSRSVTMQSAQIESTPVHTVSVLPTASGPVGYMLFNDHIATAESGLVNAIASLRDQNIVDLVLDVRYNGGGYLAIASQLAYMIAGSSRTAGQPFERTVWNDKHPNTNPVTGQALTPMPFINQTVGLSRPAGSALPTLNLDRVFILTTADTCSASEAIINGLRGVDVQVVQVGGTTCGKPYGFYDFDNCGTTYFTVQFKGVNAKNYGDYTDGFSPANTVQNRGEPVTGCSVADDLGHQLGDPTERLLSVALAYRTSGTCSLPPAPIGQSKAAIGIERSMVARPAYREIRVMRPRDLAP